MKEHKQGEVITLENGVRLQVIAHEGCDKCYFSKWYPVRCYGYNCNGGCSVDNTYIHYQQIKEPLIPARENHSGATPPPGTIK